MKKQLTYAAMLVSFLFMVSMIQQVTVIQANALSGNNTGLTAKIIATRNQVITGTVNATGFDIGVYVGPGIKGVVIKNAKIFGANDHGIFIQDTSGIVVKYSEITGNGGTPSSHNLPAGKAIVLSGTKECLIKDNFVAYNSGGGIEVTDDGPSSPGAAGAGVPGLYPGLPRPSKENVIMRNTIKDNSVACGIVVSSWDPGEGVAENLVVGNTVIGNSPGPTNLPFIGSIVIAADAPNTTARNNVVLRNTVIGGWIPGIIVHSNAPGDVVTGTVIAHNRLSDNGVEPGLNAPLPAGINIVSEVLGGSNPSVLRNTLVIWNTVTSDYYGVWHVGDTNTRIIHLVGTATVPVGP